MRAAQALTDSSIKFASFADQVPTANDHVAEYVAEATSFANAMKKFDAYGLRRSFHGFYYISHYYPLRAMDEISGQQAKDIVASLAGSTFETYLHYPFCEQICTFCHFHKKVSGIAHLPTREAAVVDMLIKELKLNRAIMGQPIRARSLQLGGGTPSLMTNGSLLRLLEACSLNMDLMPNAEIKTEIYPKTYNAVDLKEKLKILKDFGFTDIVIDLESGNSDTLAAINRSNSSLDEYLRLIDDCMAAGFNSFITALMAGLPFETYDSFYKTLDRLSLISELKVINVFPVIMRDTDPITRQLERNSAGFNDAETRDKMWLMARSVLHDRGFVDGPISYLHRPDDRPAQQADKFECVNLLGLGPSSFGYLNGSNNDWAGQYFNYCNTKDHAQRVTEGLPAIWRLGKYDNSERARRKVIFGLANVKTENLVDIERHYGVDLDSIYGQTFNALLALGLIELVRSENGIRYTKQGLARLEEITYFLYSKFAKDRSDEMPLRGDAHYEALINQHYTVTTSSKDRKTFENYESSMSSRFMHMVR